MFNSDFHFLCIKVLTLVEVYRVSTFFPPTIWLLPWVSSFWIWESTYLMGLLFPTSCEEQQVNLSIAFSFPFIFFLPHQMWEQRRAPTGIFPIAISPSLGNFFLDRLQSPSFLFYYPQQRPFSSLHSLLTVIFICVFHGVHSLVHQSFWVYSCICVADFIHTCYPIPHRGKQLPLEFP